MQRLQPKLIICLIVISFISTYQVFLPTSKCFITDSPSSIYATDMDIMTSTTPNTIFFPLLLIFLVYFLNASRANLRQCNRSIERTHNIKFVDQKTLNKNLPHGTQVTVVCKENYVWKDTRKSESKTMTCNNGEWSIKNETCTQVPSKSDERIIVAIVCSVVIVVVAIATGLILWAVMHRLRRKPRKAKKKKRSRNMRTVNPNLLPPVQTPEQASESSRGISLDGGPSETEEMSDVASEQEYPDSD